MIKPNPAFFKHHLGTILAFAGSAGVIFTAISSSKATLKANDIIRDEEHSQKRSLSSGEKTALVWKCYIPTFITGFITIACIISSDVFNLKRQAALVSAYTMVQDRIKKQKNLEEAEFSDNMDLKKVLDTDQVSFYFEFYDKIFERSMLEMVDAEYYLNRKLSIDGHAFINDFLEILSLPKNTIGDILGWDFETAWIDFDHGVEDVDGMECFIITCRTAPKTGLCIPPFYN